MVFSPGRIARNMSRLRAIGGMVKKPVTLVPVGWFGPGRMPASTGLVTQPNVTGVLEPLADADGRQHDGSGAWREHVHAVGEEFFAMLRASADVALGVLVAEHEILAGLETVRFQSVDEALARGVERRMVDQLREPDLVGPARLRLRRCGRDLVREHGRHGGNQNSTAVWMRYPAHVDPLVVIVCFVIVRSSMIPK